MKKKAPWLRKVAAAGKEFHSRKQDPKRHNRINLGWALALWGSALAVFGLGAILHHKLGLGALWVVPAGIAIGCVFMGHFILIVHECSHGMFLLFEDKDKQRLVNQRIGRVAGGMMFTNYLKHWEEGHNIHHAYPCEDNDPQDRFPITGSDLYKAFAKLWLIPFYVLKMNPSSQYGFDLKRQLGGLAFFVPLGGFAYLATGWWGPLSLYIGFTFLMTLNMVKKAQEHGCGLKFEELPILRSRTYFYATSFFTSPFNINYHFEHHANGNVPWYLLPAYHKKIQEMVPEPLRPYYFHSEFWKQLAGEKEMPSEALRELIYVDR